MKVKEAMNPDVVTCPATAKVPDVARTMKIRNIGMIPIMEGNNLLGVVTDRDITTECVAAGNIDRPVKDVIHAKPVCVSPDATLEEAARLMAEHKVRRLCVTQDGRILGVLSLDDLPTAGNTQLVAEVLSKIHPHKH
ncbi:MAG: CBS domain-containing protein [Cyanobacteria bacterium REEB65]|nr:CBS domain-containing protein [Cyanobacteria bacterium REEB65]